MIQKYRAHSTNSSIALTSSSIYRFVCCVNTKLSWLAEACFIILIFQIIIKLAIEEIIIIYFYFTVLEWHKYILSPKSAIKYDDGPNQFYKINWKSFQDKLKECYLQLVLFYCKKCIKGYVSICHVVHSTASREKSALFYQEFSEIIDFSRTKWNMNYTVELENFFK